jgi:hypothetical protein
VDARARATTPTDSCRAPSCGCPRSARRSSGPDRAW